MAYKALKRMMERKNHLVTMVSASVNLGGELLLKEAQIWARVLSEFQKFCVETKEFNLESSAMEKGELLDIDAIADLFEHNKLEAKIYHSRTVCSRTRVIAPNPDTAVGYTGDIFVDECGRIPNFKDVFEAILPIMDSNPDFDFLAATTPPPDDKHETYEMFLPPEMNWNVNPRGNWYKVPCGIDSHRLDAWDGYAAGALYYHPQTREIITPEKHRELLFDKTAWDRNHAVKFLSGGSAAVSIADIQRAMAMGRGNCTGNYTTEEVVNVL